MRLSRAVATFGGVGLLRPGPGTWGSAAALPLAWLLHGTGGFPLLAAATLVVTVAGFWAAGAEDRATGQADAGEVVIDEVAGQWLALWPLSFGLWQAGAAAWTFPWPGWVTAFVAFRLLDIVKPGPVGWADRQRGAWGVMADDLIAGGLAALVVLAGAALAHGIMGL